MIVKSHHMTEQCVSPLGDDDRDTGKIDGGDDLGVSDEKSYQRIPYAGNAYGKPRTDRLVRIRCSENCTPWYYIMECHLVRCVRQHWPHFSQRGGAPETARVTLQATHADFRSLIRTSNLIFLYEQYMGNAPLSRSPLPLSPHPLPFPSFTLLCFRPLSSPAANRPIENQMGLWGKHFDVF